MLTVTYIYHDCFVAETPSAVLVFDYWREPEGFGFVEWLKRLAPGKPLYILVSHHHKDHFNRTVLKWGDMREKVHFILSEDTAKSVRYMLRPDSVYTGVRPRAEQVSVLKPGSVYADDAVRIEAYSSTDIGNSYMVVSGGYSLFHAGDLNAWIWKDESTVSEVEQALGDYSAILDCICEAGHRTMDVAMFPVDSRLGTDYWEGARIFVRRFDVGLFLPMHFCLGQDSADEIAKMADACSFREYANPTRGIYAALQQPYSAVSLPDK